MPRRENTGVHCFGPELGCARTPRLEHELLKAIQHEALQMLNCIKSPADLSSACNEPSLCLLVPLRGGWPKSVGGDGVFKRISQGRIWDFTGVRSQEKQGEL